MATYKGTAIWGTDKVGRLFPGSKIANARVNQTYLNTSSGHVYLCTAAGKPSEAKWKYDHTDIIKKPASKVSSLCTPVRKDDGGYSFTSKWKVPSALTNAESGARATALRLERTISGKNGKKSFTLYNAANIGTGSTEATVNANSFTGTVGKKGSKKSTYSRSSFYPYTALKVTSIGVALTAFNGKGYGPAASVARTIGVPGQPKVATPAVDTETWRVSCEITPYQDTGSAVHRERAQTVSEVQVFDSSAAKPAWKTVQTHTTATDNAFTLSYDVANAQLRGKYVMVRFRSKSRGLAGDSEWTGWKSHTVGWPATATIKSVEMKSVSPTQYGTCYVKSNSSSQYPVDRMVLQALVSTDAATVAEANAAEGWRDTEFVDNANATALAFLVGDMVPEMGKRSWLRVKTWHDKESVFAMFSNPVQLAKLYKAEPPDPTAADDAVVVVSVDPGADGQSAAVTFAWDANGNDDSDGTEVSWAADELAWDSTEEPSTFRVPNDRDEGGLEYGGLTYRSSYTLTIRGLAQGEQLCVRCRRYMESNSTYGPYSNTGKAVPAIAPTDAVLIAPAFVAEGAGIAFSWAFAGGGTQRGWRLRTADGAVVASGTDSVGSCTVPADTAAAYADSGVLSCFVEVSTGGGYVQSNTASVTIAAPPVLSIGAMGPLAAQPLSIPIECTTATAQVAIVVTAQGTEGAAPDGASRQLAGDTVWSALVSPEWALDAEAGLFKASVEAPGALDLRDLASYSVDASAVDTVTGLGAMAEQASFAVAWAHQAPVPSEDIAIEPSVSEDADGRIRRMCTITLAAPDGASEGDVYDIYRLTGDGAQLIGANLALDSEVVDEYAPFGEGARHYRIACRTADGDAAWRDFEYALDGLVIRFDFDGEGIDWLELRWDVEISESYAKDFEATRQMDGTIGGAWNKGVEHTASMSAHVLRLSEPGQIDAIRALARTVGPVFVRTGFGSAFAANVDVSGIESNAIDGVGFAVSLTAREIDLVDEFALPGAEDEEE